MRGLGLAMLCAGCVVAAFTPAAASVVIESGTIGGDPDNLYPVGFHDVGGNYLQNGVYTFTTSAVLDLNGADISASEFYSQSGQNFGPPEPGSVGDWGFDDSFYGIVEPVLNEHGFTLTIDLPSDYELSGGPGPCGSEGFLCSGDWDEFDYFTFQTLSVIPIQPGGEGKTWTFSYSPLGQTVPEPGAWALMLAGFGLTGCAMRRLRERQTPAAMT